MLCKLWKEAEKRVQGQLGERLGERCERKCKRGSTRGEIREKFTEAAYTVGKGRKGCRLERGKGLGQVVASAKDWAIAGGPRERRGL